MPMNYSCVSESYNKIGSVNNWFQWLPPCHQEAGVNTQLTRGGLWEEVVFCSEFCHLGGMEAISTTNSENEAEPEENSHHTPFASPLETPHHYF